MKKDKPDSGKSKDLRRKAEEKLRKKKAKKIQKMDDAEMRALAHELQVHQIELEMQNEELERARAEAEDALLKYTDLYDFAPVGYFTFDKKGTILEVNLAGANLLGIERNSLVKSQFRFFIEPDSRAGFNSFCKRVVETDVKQTCELMLKNEKSLICALIEGMAVHDAGGSGKQIRAAIIDVTGRKEAEDQLKLANGELRQRTRELILSDETLHSLQAIFNSMGEGLVVADIKGDFIYINPTAEKILGKGLRKVTAYEWSEQYRFYRHDMVTPYHAEELPISRAIRGESVVRAEMFVQHVKEPISMWMSVTARPLTDEHDVLKGGVVAFHDITEHKKVEARLVESETQFRTVMETANDAIICLKEPGIIYMWNKNAEKIFGYRADEAIGKDMHELIVPEGHREKAYPGIKTFFQQGKGTIIGKTLELSALRRDGSEFPIEITVSAMQIKGKWLASGIVRDISERKRTEDRFKKLSCQNELILNSAGEGIYGLDREGCVTFINPAASKMLGWEVGELTGKFMHAITHHSKPDGTPYPPEECPVFTVLQKGEVQRGDNEMFWRKNGTSFPVRYASTPIVEQDKVVGAVVTFDDITERKRTELEYKTVLGTTMDGFWVTDTEGRLLDVNDASCRLTGYSREELLTMRIQDIEDKETQEETAQHVKKIMETGYDCFETRHRCKDGRIVDVEASVNYVKIADGLFFAFFRDITERKKSEAQIRSQLQQLAVISNIDKAILSILDMRVILDVFLDKAFPQLHVDAADILLFNPYMQTLEYAVGRGFHTSAILRTRVCLGEGCCGRAAVERRPVFVRNLCEESCVRSRQLSMEESFVSYYAVPLIAKGQVNGVLEVFHRAPFDPGQEWLDFLGMLAGQAAIAIDNANLFEGLQHANTELFQAYDKTIEGWSKALDLRDKETEGHSLRVTDMTVQISIAMGINSALLIHVRWGALLHDIGKMGVPDNILFKADKLTDEEWVIMRRHPVYAYELLSPIAYLRPALDIPHCHHEKWDGTGYPRGLKGEGIPLAARIFAVVDVWDAMRSDRPYRKGWEEEKVREYMKSLAGTHFDPNVVEVFLKEKW